MKDESDPRERQEKVKNFRITGLGVSLTLFVLLGWNDEGFSQNPVPDIKLNHSDGPILLSQSDTLTISVAMEGGARTDNADWWFIAATPFGIFCLTPDGWTNSISPVYQGPLFNLPSVDLSRMPLLSHPAGIYDFYLAVDTVMDGSITFNELS